MALTESKKLRLDFTSTEMGMLMGISLRLMNEPKLKAQWDEMLKHVRPQPESRSGRLAIFKDGSIWVGDSLLVSFLGPYEDKEVNVEVSELE